MLTFFIIYWSYNWCQKERWVIFFSYFVPWQEKWFEGFTKGDIFLWVNNKAVSENEKWTLASFSFSVFEQNIDFTCFIAYSCLAFISKLGMLNDHARSKFVVLEHLSVLSNAFKKVVNSLTNWKRDMEEGGGIIVGSNVGVLNKGWLIDWLANWLDTFVPF